MSESINHDIATMSHNEEGKPSTLISLLEKYMVEVPIVQRDYAQGRLDEHSKMVRQNLLADMKSAILGTTLPLDLNFVYGKTEGNKFIPLDGQQRLTTLYLLHLYAFHNDVTKTEILRKFTYETRKSSRDFLEKLCENREAVFKSLLPPSKEIEDSEWFVSAWVNDPTIQSVVIMLDEIKVIFEKVDELSLRLCNHDIKPIVFSFLEMKDLGMEDSLYIKLNARGKPLTSFENFKARLIGSIKKQAVDFEDRFEQCFDREWTELFWSKYKETFDQTYLTFFGVLFMNQGICLSDANWSNALDYEKINTEILENAYYVLNYLSDNKNNRVHEVVFKALLEKRTYPDRVMFHAVSTYLYRSKGKDNGSFTQWLRILGNLTGNSQIDTQETYRRAVDAINKLADQWNDLIVYFSDNGAVSGFSQDQIEEERVKARIILKSEINAEEIYKAEKHPYFGGQIRSALFYAKYYDVDGDIDVFKEYWNKISLLFENTKPKYGSLLRRSLLTIGDYTLSVSGYKTLCVDDPGEASSTPSLKRLFSNHGSIVKKLLDSININDDIKDQLEAMVSKVQLPKNDWRYCFLAFPQILGRMSTSHLRLRFVDGEILLVSNKSSNGYNYEIFLTALHERLKQQGINSLLEGELGTWADRYLNVRENFVRVKNGKFVITNSTQNIIFESKADNPIDEASVFLASIL